ncbi:MAG: type II toxin-antitoxin system VapC family toxin [Caldilineaceae bacterium]|nr:type II toxin-antitoxin system VapC family toxin [Caldilineaceae bacterium]HRJ44906.1 type II toxin-antitoxin system VapC family toxin [Caldilineaceae bacterium]
MAHYLLDANHLSPLVTLTHPLRQRILGQQRTQDVFSVPAPALSEMLFGIQVLPRREQNLRERNHLSPFFGFYGIEQVDAEKAAHLRVELRRIGRQLEALDAFIAVIAIRFDLILLTTDRDFDPIPGLQRDNWL